MDEQPISRRIATTALLILLWVISFVLGLNAIYLLLQIFYLVYGALGGSLSAAENFAPILLFLLGVGFLIFIIATSEFHRKNVGTRQSWRLFTWTIAIEISIILLYYIL
jgi:hypothetical protein